jgi:ankyrin repeat protein
MSFRKVSVWCVALLAVALISYFAARSEGFLFWSIRHHFHDLTAISLRLGASPNAQQGTHTALMEAALRGETSVVSALLDRGATINATDEDRREALHYAAKNEQKDGAVVRLLLEHGADPLAASKDGVTPLMEAVSGMGGGTVMNGIAMVAYAGEVNQQDRDGNTALLIASTEAGTVVVRALLRAGANPNLANSKGTLPITAVARNGLSDRVQLLLAFGADPSLRQSNMPSATELVRQTAPNPELEAKFREIAHIIETSGAKSHQE